MGRRDAHRAIGQSGLRRALPASVRADGTSLRPGYATRSISVSFIPPLLRREIDPRLRLITIRLYRLALDLVLLVFGPLDF